MEDAETCPQCGSREVVPIIYGTPTEEEAEKARRGEVALADFVNWPEAPNKICRSCDTSWYECEGYRIF